MSRAVNQQPTYTQIFLWCIDAVTQNRGVIYDSWFQESQVTVEEVEEEDITAEQIPGIRADGLPRVRRDGTPIMVYPKVTRYRKKRVPGPGYNKIDIVSPYDFTRPLNLFRRHLSDRDRTRVMPTFPRQA